MNADNAAGRQATNDPSLAAVADLAAAQHERLLAAGPQLRSVVDAMPHLVMVLNTPRQIVAANRSLLEFVGASEESLIGMRPGEALSCGHLSAGPDGCGSSEFCASCGALHAVLAGQRDLSAERECRFMRGPTGEALDFRVWATPLEMAGDKFTVLAMLDVSPEKRLRALERIFFHDILNTATAVKAAAGMISRDTTGESRELVGLLVRLVERMIDDILGQRQLVEAEGDELQVVPASVDLEKLLQNAAAAYRAHAVGAGRTVCVETPGRAFTFVSDPALLSRVLGNMLKNALEATPEAGVVTAGYQVDGSAVEIYVRNPGAMPRNVQLQVFQRSFSTKGAGRGLGTYSMRLLTERYLHGSISFESSAEAGTTFTARYPLVM